MPLVFVHGVATRMNDAYRAEVVQRDALFKKLVMGDDALVINPYWGDGGAKFDPDMPWLPSASGNEAYGAGASAMTSLNLGRLSQRDGAQAVDLAIGAMLQKDLDEAVQKRMPALAARKASIGLALAAGDYLRRVAPGDEPVGIPALASDDNFQFAAALESELSVDEGTETFGAVGDAIMSGRGQCGGWIANGASDIALSSKREDASRMMTFFLGDVFVYLRGRDIQGAEGVGERLFAPIVDSLVSAWTAKKESGGPLVVVGHSLGGVLLYDLLTDDAVLKTLRDRAPGFEIDLLATVGSQAGFFAGMKLFKGKSGSGGKLAKPGVAKSWHNVFDYTDVFSFLAKPLFHDVADYSYDTVVDLVAAHTTYFKRPSFYQRLKARLPQ